MERTRERKLIHLFFLVVLIGKGLDGLMEIAGGFLLLFFSHYKINKIIISLTQHELSKDPDDFIASTLAKLAHSFTANTQIFLTIYLLVHGAFKMFMIIALLKRKLWAYPMAIVVFSLFIIYQQYRYFINYSIMLLGLSMLDVILIVLTLSEYHYLKREIRMKKSS